LIAAAGCGERLGLSRSKALVALGGRPLVSYSLDAFRASSVEEIVLVAPPQAMEQFRQLIARGPADKTEKVVAGGGTRQESVWAGLCELSAGMECVLIHDAARPFLCRQLIEDCADAARRHGAAIAAVPVSDTLKFAEGDVVRGSADRRDLWVAQTPQAFRVEIIRAAYEQARREGRQATDDAALVEAMGRAVRLVPGSPRNIKVTYPQDLAMAETMLRGEAQPVETRCGIGYDMHRLVAGRRLVLGGVEFPGAAGLAGHSDADALAHAVCDALLGAAGLGDIGQHFPDRDPRYADADSIELLRQAAAMAAEAGFRVVHVDAVVIADAPRIAGEVSRMRQRLGEALGIAPERVSVKGKTSEGLGFVGAGEGIACHAVCTCVRARESETTEPC
jgi:2-C-methyl-D-erythritol 4-phosphate cytidylyltransferase/2-C-methyl-D-erythritol 2,4-cyclodiphosphate synthase